MTKDSSSGTPGRRYLWAIVFVAAGAAVLVFVLAFNDSIRNPAVDANANLNENTPLNTSSNYSTGTVDEEDEEDGGEEAEEADAGELFVIALAAGDLTPIQDYMAENILVTEEGEDCCGYLGPAEAITEIEGYTEGVTLDFGQTQPAIEVFKERYPALVDFTIGISEADRFALAFRVSADNKIDQVYMNNDFVIMWAYLP